MQLAHHLNFYLGSTKATEARIAWMEEKVADAKKELFKAKTRASKVKGKFWEQKESMNTLLKNIVCSAIKLGEESSCVASMH